MKQNLRMYIATPDTPIETVMAEMRKAGFKAIDDKWVCPVKFMPPWDVVNGRNGAVVYRQWEAELRLFQVWYMKPDFFRDGILGYEFLKKAAKLPNPKALYRTHEYLRDLAAFTPEIVWTHMQGEHWSPHGEARSLIEERKLCHTSMSMGDVLIDPEGLTWMADSFGFKQL